MNTTILFVILASLSGLGAGYLLAIISPGEMKPGKKYLLLFERIVRAFVFVPVLFFGAAYDYWLILLVAVLAVSFVLNFSGRLVFLYLSFILMIFLTQESSAYLVQASLVFLYGLPAGSLLKIRLFSLEK